MGVTTDLFEAEDEHGNRLELYWRVDAGKLVLAVDLPLGDEGYGVDFMLTTEVAERLGLALLDAVRLAPQGPADRG